MIATQFAYEAPATLDEALALLAQNADDTKILAGGHSLIPAMKLRLAQPAMLIDIARIAGLSYIREEAGQIRLGAATTHYQIESSELLKRVCPLLPECAATIGDVQVRNKGTIGGSLAHADPSGDWPAAIFALNAEMIAVSGRGERVIKADDFFVDMLTTTLEPDEILREIRVPIVAGAGQAYLKVRQPASGFAVVGVAVSATREAVNVGITGVASIAYRARAVEDALRGQVLDGANIAAAAARAADGVDANSDLFASAEYRCHLARVYTRRVLEKAAKKFA
jgi:carbon-monoxide dehydrogenase medium subunit